MSYTNNSETSESEEVRFSFVIASHNGFYDCVYGSPKAVELQVVQLRRRYPGAKLVRTYNNIPFYKVQKLREGVENLNNGKKINLDSIVK